MSIIVSADINVSDFMIFICMQTMHPNNYSIDQTARPNVRIKIASFHTPPTGWAKKLHPFFIAMLLSAVSMNERILARQELRVRQKGLHVSQTSFRQRL